MKFNPTLHEIVNEEAERLGKKPELINASAKLDLEAKVEGTLENKGGFLEIGGVSYRGAIHTVHLLKGLLDNGASRTQDAWAEYSKQTQARGEFYVPDFPLLHGIVTALHEQRNEAGKKEIEEIRSGLKKQIRENWLVTLTRVRYNAAANDQVINNFGMADQYTKNGDFVGPDGAIKDVNAPELYHALLGTNDVDKIRAVYEWLNGTDTHMWRVNARPEKGFHERVARLCADSSRMDLDCYRYAQNSDPARGVRLVRAKKI